MERYGLNISLFLLLAVLLVHIVRDELDSGETSTSWIGIGVNSLRKVPGLNNYLPPEEEMSVASLECHELPMVGWTQPLRRLQLTYCRIRAGTYHWWYPVSWLDQE